MKNTNRPTLNYIRQQRDEQLDSLDDAFTQLKQKYNISEQFYTKDEKDWSESEKAFYFETGRLLIELSAKALRTEFGWFVKFLIATNIARRRHLLHIDTMLKKLQKYGSDGEHAINVYDECVSVYDLQKKLAPYGITIMSKNLYEEYFEKGTFQWREYSRSRLAHFESFMKKFHTSAGKSRPEPKGYKIQTKRFNVTKQQLRKLMLEQSRQKDDLPF